MDKIIIMCSIAKSPDLAKDKEITISRQATGYPYQLSLPEFTLFWITISSVQQSNEITGLSDRHSASDFPLDP
jgi:hypothetical protein